MVILKAIYTAYAWFTWTLIGFWAFLWSLIISLVQGRKGLSKIIMGYKIFAKCWFFIIGIRMRVKGKEVRDTAEPCIIISNHGSAIDMMTAPHVIKTKVSPLAKEELKKIPMLGYMFKAVSVFVNRKSPESRKKSLDEIRKRLNEGIYIFMYPEGTRNRTGKPLKDFYDGAFKMAIEIQKPIMPLVFLNVQTVAPVKGLMRPGVITAEFMKPVSTLGLTLDDVDMLKEKIFSMMYNYIQTNDPYFMKRK